MPKHVMLDLETYGLTPGSIILSIGAVAFDTNGLYEEFYEVIDLKASKAWKFTEDAGTVLWWKKQSPEARKSVFEAKDVVLPHIVVKDFTAWAKMTEATSVWSNGADFDIPVLQAYYNETGGTWPFSYKNHRCFRTLKAMCPNQIVENNTTKHNALEDAKWQARYAQKCIQWVVAARGDKK